MPYKKKTVVTTHPSTDRERKNLLFLTLITSKGSISRTDLSNLTDINIVTVSNYINNYLKKSLVLERGYDISSGGRRPELIEMNKRWGYVVGIHIDQNKIRGVISNLGMEILESKTITREKKDLNPIIVDFIKKLQNAQNGEPGEIKRINICYSENKENSTKDKLGEVLGVPILIASDALCAAFGEKTSNSYAKEVPTVLYIYKDTGEGILIKNGELYQANDAELKKSYLRKWGPKISIVAEAKRMVKNGVGTSIIDMTGGKPEDITDEIIIKAAKEEDEVTRDLIRTSGMNLGVRVAYLINSFEPETVIIGGGIEEAGDLFMKPFTSSIKRFIRQKISDRVKVVPAVLGREACVKGSAFLAIREAFIEG